MNSCPCGSTSRNRAIPYLACCGRYIEDYLQSPAPDATSLMRSRYTAFVLQRPDYLLATWHPSTRPESIDFEDKVKWLGLDIRTAQEPSSPDEDQAWVEFVARSRVAGRGQRLHERSRFVREQGRWFYIDGDIYY